MSEAPPPSRSQAVKTAMLPATEPAAAQAGVLRPLRNSQWWLALLLMVGTIAAYRPAWQAGFIWDDHSHVENNTLLVAPDGLKRIWFSFDSPQYYPLVFTTFRLERAFWGLNPAGYHWVNLLLHGLDALLVWRLLRRLRVPGAWLAAALFALHPVNVESAAWITERKNTLSMFFFLLSLFWYLRFDEQTEGRGSPQTLPCAASILYALSLCAFVLALFSKTAVAPLPVVLLGLAWWRRGWVARRDLLRSAPFFAAALVLIPCTILCEHHAGAEIVRADGFCARLAGAGWAFWFYLYKAVWPLHLMFVYPRWRIDPLNPLSYLPGLLVLGIFVLCWRFRQRWGKSWLLGLGYFAVMLLPALGLVNIYFMRYSLVSDHWQYFAILGPLALAAAGMTRALDLVGKGLPWLKPIVLGALLLVLGGLTGRQSAAYADDETLWRASIAANPECWMAYNNLGLILFSRGQADAAMAHYRKALEFEPANTEARNNLGNALFQQGKLPEAMAEFRQALAIRPGDAEMHDNFATVLLQAGQSDEARAHFQKALAIWPNDARAHGNLGNLLVQNGQVRQALAHYQAALRLQPTNVLVLNNLAWVLATCPDASVRDGARALELAQRAERFAGGTNPAIGSTLAAAYAELGQFGEAVTTARQALALAAARTNTALIEGLRANLELYEKGSPFHEASQTNSGNRPQRP